MTSKEISEAAKARWAAEHDRNAEPGHTGMAPAPKPDNKEPRS